MVTKKLEERAARLADRLQFLSVDQIMMIDEALDSVGDYGEVRLSVQRGRLRFLVMQKSFDALKGKLPEGELGLLVDGG